MGMVTLPGAGPVRARRAYLAVPVATRSEPGPWPGVLVVHEGPGMTDDMREQCDWLAAAGYLAVMPDLYHGRSMIRCVKGVVRQCVEQRGPAFEQLEASRSWLADREDCTGAVGVIGYCMGGGFALVLAGRPGYAVSSVNYGQLPENLDEILGGACPVIASFGGRDPTLKGAAPRLTTALRRAGVPHDVREYPDAGHTFINRSAVGPPISSLMRVLGFSHDHEAAADAKRRILAFFDRHLRPTGS